MTAAAACPHPRQASSRPRPGARRSSVNYNNGPWTVGGYYQYATAEGSTTTARNDRLSALEVGASYRFTTKARIYGAWYRFDFADDEPDGLPATGNVFVVGVRLDALIFR